MFIIEFLTIQESCFLNGRHSSGSGSQHGQFFYHSRVSRMVSQQIARRSLAMNTPGPEFLLYPLEHAGLSFDRNNIAIIFIITY